MVALNSRGYNSKFYLTYLYDLVGVMFRRVFYGLECLVSGSFCKAARDYIRIVDYIRYDQFTSTSASLTANRALTVPDPRPEFQHPLRGRVNPGGQSEMHIRHRIAPTVFCPAQVGNNPNSVAVPFRFVASVPGHRYVS